MIVGAGNRIMAGRGAPALANEPSLEGTTIDVRAVDKCFIEFRSVPEHGDARRRDAMFFAGTPFASGEPQAKGPSITQLQAARALKECAEFIIASAWPDPKGRLNLASVLILSRTGFAYGLELSEFEQRLRWILGQHPELANPANSADLSVMTAHKAKGKEADAVIVLDVTTRQFPKIHADNVLFQPFDVTVEDSLSEERRLFYVAITRAERRLLLLTETGQESPFLNELQLDRGLGDLERSAGKQDPKVEPLQLSEIGGAIRSRIKAIDPWDMVIGNASPGIAPMLTALRAQSWPPPQIEYGLTKQPGSPVAELAWPALRPPAAILAGVHAERADEWRKAGWRVLSP